VQDGCIQTIVDAARGFREWFHECIGCSSLETGDLEMIPAEMNEIDIRELYYSREYLVDHAEGSVNAFVWDDVIGGVHEVVCDQVDSILLAVENSIRGRM
jgi:hypothetical protein